MTSDKGYLVLGLDPGIASCGFCLLDLTNHSILEMGVHLFDAPQDPKTKVSFAVGRRSARSARRNNLRTKMRMKHCLELLAGAGLVPLDADRNWFQSRPGDRPVLKLRARGLDVRLTDREFAQVLYVLCRRRGYIPHGEGRLSQTDDAEGRKVLNAIRENTEALESGKYRTVGEMLNAEGASRNRGGDYTRCVYNAQIQDEVHALFSAQRALGNEKATEYFEVAYLDCLTWEKPSLDHDEKTYELVGQCSYFPEEKRAANADISSELCRAYERFGHIVIVREDGTELTLTKRQINEYLSVLFSPSPIKKNKDCKVRYSDIRRDLDLSGNDRFKGVDFDDEKSSEPFAPKSWRCLRSNGISEELLQRFLDDHALGDAVGEALTFASSEHSLFERLSKLDLSEDEAEEILGVPFTGKLFKGYGSRSLKALGMLLDAFEGDCVRTLKDAEENSGLLGWRLADSGNRSTLLPPYDTYDPTCRNPVVLRAMGRMRRIVNAIIRIYGVPDEIHIELGRDLKRSNHEKAIVSRRQKQNAAANKKWSEIAGALLGIAPEEVKGSIIRKLSLREEQGEKDLYTGKAIDLERLVRDDRYCEIDHILPYSRTCDDSRANKVLVLSKSNQDKRERTPYEWMVESGEPGAPDWAEFKARVFATVKDRRKVSRLLNDNLDRSSEQEFINRNLNDDRYMSVAVKNYLEDSLLFPENGRKKHVSAVSGGATGNLRWVWGLNFGDHNDKDRSDDRHHAVDAAIIAACSEKTVRKVAEASAKGRETFKHLRKSRLSNTQPWPTFAEDIIARRERVIPTRMINHGVTGRVFEDTLYHLEGYSEDKGRYPLVRASGKTSKKGNVVTYPDGSARLVDGLAFLRLWLDKTAKGPKGSVGKWYAEPIYYADIPAIKNGTYVPRACKIHVARVNWEPVPSCALESEPIVLHRGEALIVDEHIGRFWKFSISSCGMEIRDISTGKPIGSGFPSTPTSWNASTSVSVLKEDCLGHCYDYLSINQDESTFDIE